MMYETMIKTDKFLTPNHNRNNSGFGEDMARFYAGMLHHTEKYIVSNILLQDPGYGFWISIKKEKFWFSVELTDALEKTWKLKLGPSGMASVTYTIMRKTFRGERIISDIEEINNLLLSGHFDR